MPCRTVPRSRRTPDERAGHCFLRSCGRLYHFVELLRLDLERARGRRRGQRRRQPPDRRQVDCGRKPSLDDGPFSRRRSRARPRRREPRSPHSRSVRQVPEPVWKTSIGLVVELARAMLSRRQRSAPPCRVDSPISAFARAAAALIRPSQRDGPDRLAETGSGDACSSGAPESLCAPVSARGESTVPRSESRVAMAARPGRISSPRPFLYRSDHGHRLAAVNSSLLLVGSSASMLAVMSSTFPHPVVDKRRPPEAALRSRERSRRRLHPPPGCVTPFT